MLRSPLEYPSRGLIFSQAHCALEECHLTSPFPNHAVTVALPPRRLPQNLPNIQPVSPGHPPSILPGEPCCLLKLHIFSC